MRIIPETESVVVIWERRLFYCDIQTVISCWYLLSQSLAFGNWVSRGLQITTDRSKCEGHESLSFSRSVAEIVPLLTAALLLPRKNLKPHCVICGIDSNLFSFMRSPNRI